MPKPEIGPETVENEVKSDNLSVKVTKKPHCQVKFEIHILPKVAEATYQTAIKNVRKEISVPGFRKGKAPVPFILERYASTLQREFVDLILHLGFKEACELTHLHPLTDGAIERPVIQECSREKGAHFFIEFESRPIIPAISLEEIKIKKIPEPPVSDQDLANVLNNLLLRFATYDPIEDRPAQEGDFVDLSISLLEDPPQEIIHNQRVQVDPSQLSNWICRSVIGLRAGESAEGMTEQDLAFSSDSDFESRPFRLTVNAIWKGTLPSLNDEFAKQAGVQSIEELKEKIHQRLVNDNREETFKKQLKTLEKAVLNKYSLDIPLTYLTAQTTQHLEHYLKQAEEKNIFYTAEERKELEKQIRETSLQELQFFFLTRRLISDHQIKVDQQDLSKELAHQMTLMSSGRSSLQFDQEKQTFYKELERLALERKVEQFLMDHVTLVE